MIRKVLIAEDHDTVNISVQITLETSGISDSHYVHYCDDALLKIKKAIEAGDSYDLLITDLSFEEGYRTEALQNGIALIEAARKEQPDLKILVFSAESRAVIIKKLFDEQAIDGYVRKARGDAKELLKAVDAIRNNQRYYPRHLIEKANTNTHEFTEFDVKLISLMIEGKRQKEISDYLKQHNIRPSATSSIEKRLAHIKEELNFSTNEQLIAHCVKMGIV